MKNENQKENKKLTLKERLKDKRERAKLELIFYGIFFIGVIIFAKVIDSSTPSNIEDNNQTFKSFIYSINDNYEYDIQIALNSNIYKYYGKVLGNNSTINLNVDEKVNSYYLMNNKYYILENDNYILTNGNEVYPYIDYRYLNINNIKEYINISTKENETYKVKISDLVLGNESKEYISISINEGDNNIIIDYTPLLKLNDSSIEKIEVTITYSNIDKVISLEE